MPLLMIILSSNYGLNTLNVLMVTYEHFIIGGRRKMSTQPCNAQNLLEYRKRKQTSEENH